MPKSKWWKTIPVLALFLASCGGQEEPEAADAPGSEPADAVADSASAPAAPAEGVEPQDTGAWVMERPDGASPAPDGWTAGASTGGTAGGIATLTAVRSARHADYDRVVFEFDTHVPAYRIDYVDSPQEECGSGEAVRVAGDGWLRVALEPANAHTEAGQPTAPRRITDPAGTNLRELRRICDFEAHVDWVIGVGSPNRYRAFTLERPARLVIDIRN